VPLLSAHLVHYRHRRQPATGGEEEEARWIVKCWRNIYDNMLQYFEK
jgi:hypothetical protein